MDAPALFIQFDADTWAPVAVFPVADTNQEAAWLRMLAQRMIEALPKPEVPE